LDALEKLRLPAPLDFTLTRKRMRVHATTASHRLIAFKGPKSLPHVLDYEDRAGRRIFSPR
jgi:hypothetical protein